MTLCLVFETAHVPVTDTALLDEFTEITEELNTCIEDGVVATIKAKALALIKKIRALLKTLVDKIKKRLKMKSYPNNFQKHLDAIKDDAPLPSTNVQYTFADLIPLYEGGAAFGKSVRDNILAATDDETINKVFDDAAKKGSNSAIAMKFEVDLAKYIGSLDVEIKAKQVKNFKEHYKTWAAYRTDAKNEQKARKARESHDNINWIDVTAKIDAELSAAEKELSTGNLIEAKTASARVNILNRKARYLATVAIYLATQLDGPLFSAWHAHDDVVLKAAK